MYYYVDDDEKVLNHPAFIRSMQYHQGRPQTVSGRDETNTVSQNAIAFMVHTRMFRI